MIYEGELQAYAQCMRALASLHSQMCVGVGEKKEGGGGGGGGFC
jgi:hypothetical protein